MATENRSIEISYKANLKDLISKLKQMPDVTSREAKSMVSALDRQLKQAEKAAKRAAAAQQKAAAAGSRAFSNASTHAQQLSKDAEEAGQKLDHIAESAGDADRGFSAMGLALSKVNPALGEAAMLGADVMAVSEGILMTIRALNPMWLAGAAALAVVTLGYAAYADGVEQAKEKVLELREAQRQENEAFSDQADNLRNAKEKLQEQKDAYLELTGQVSEYDAAIKKATKGVTDSFQPNIDAQQEIIDLRNKDLELVRRVQSGSAILSEEEEKRLRTLQLQTDAADNNVELIKSGVFNTGSAIKQDAALLAMENALVQEKANQGQIMSSLLSMRSSAITLASTQVDLEHELMQAAAEQAAIEAQRAARRAKGQAWAAKRNAAQEKLNSMILQGKSGEERITAEYQKQKDEIDKIADKYGSKVTGAVDARNALEKKYMEDLAAERERVADEEEQREKERQAAIDERIKKEIEFQKAVNKLQHEAHLNSLSRDDEALQRIRDKYQLEFYQLAELMIETDNLAMRRQAANDLDRKMAEELHALEMRQQEQRLRGYEQISKVFTQSTAQFASSIEGYLSNTDRLTEESAQKLFMLNKMAALADIAFNTAVNISKYAGTGPAAPFLIAGVTAAGAAQAAAVASQPMPTLHMGGTPYMAPDESPAKLLKGEAVLDRTTTRLIGGESGIRDMLNGKNNQGPIIIQPFKHFGRYNRAARKRAGSKLGSGRY